MMIVGQYNRHKFILSWQERASWLIRAYKYPTNWPKHLSLTHFIAKATHVECDKKSMHNEGLECLVS